MRGSFRIFWLVSIILPRLVYAQAGVPLWTNVVNSSGTFNDIPVAMTVDAKGNVFVSGYAVNGSFSTSGYLTVGYSNSGLPLWTNRYDGVDNGWDVASAIAADAQGDIFVTGGSSGNGSGNDYTTLKYSGNGMPLWTNRYNGPIGFSDDANALCVDAAGNVYVTGKSYGNSVNLNYATVKYSNSGIQSWAQRYTAGNTDYALAIAVDTNGNVLVTGFSVGSGTQTDFATIKYSSTGSELWAARYNGPGNSSDEAHAIAVGPGGNVCVTGFSGSDILTIQYSNAGAPMWTNRYHGPSSGAYGNAIAIDSNSNVFAAGFAYGIGTGKDYLLLKYSSAGVPLWTNRYAGSSSGDDDARAVAVDKSGNVYLAGNVSGVGGTVIAYSSDGVGLWTNRYPAYPTYSPLALDRDGNVFVAGAVSGPGTGLNYLTIRYSALTPSQIPLHITHANDNAILTWADARFELQAASTLGGSFTNILLTFA